jgi:hypothetical protein
VAGCQYLRNDMTHLTNAFRNISSSINSIKISVRLKVPFRSPSLFYLLVHSRCRGCLFALVHNQTHTTVGRTPLDEGSARRRDLYLTTETLYKRQKIHAPRGIRTHDPRKPSAADLRLRPRSHWVRPVYLNKITRNETCTVRCNT